MIRRPTSPSPRLVKAAMLLGVPIIARTGSARDRHAKLLRACDAAAGEVAASLTNRGVAYITGPSGGGKSTVLRALARQLRARSSRIIRVNHAATSIARSKLPIAHLCLSTPVQRWLSILAAAGLGEPALLPLTPAMLSDGQRHRLALAACMQLALRATTEVWVLCDEFASVLDRPAALGLSATIARWTRKSESRVRLVVCTAHDDLRTLEADITVRCGLDGQPIVQAKRRATSDEQQATSDKPTTTNGYERLRGRLNEADGRNGELGDT